MSILASIFPAVMMILYVAVLVYFFMLFIRLVRAVEDIASKLESSLKD